jgi:hypothetical protein
VSINQSAHKINRQVEHSLLENLAKHVSSQHPSAEQEKKPAVESGSTDPDEVGSFPAIWL